MYTITVNTDASFDWRTGKAAWAMWIKSADFGMAERDSGMFEQPVANSSVAELLAFEMALRRVHEAVGMFPRKFVKIYVNTDSMWTVQALKGNVKKSKHVEIAKSIKALTDGYEIDARHVKAHVRKDTKRHWVNDWCDKQAKKLLRDYLKKEAARGQA